MPVRVRFGVAILLAALLVLAGCGEGQPAAGPPVSLRMTVWSTNEAHLKLFNEIATEYRRLHPNVRKISFDPLPAESYDTMLINQVIEGRAPDLAWISERAAPDLIQGEALVPLDDPLGSTEGYALDDLIPTATRLWRYQGQLYAYPFSTSPFGVFANLDLLRSAGQPTPAEMIASGRWTWDAVAGTAAAVASRTGRAGIVIRDFDDRNWDYLSTVWAGWGARTWGDDGRTCEFTRPEMVDAFTFLHRAVVRDRSMLGPAASVDFFTGQAAYTVTQISRASLLKGGFGWDLVGLPAGPKGRYAVIGQGAMGVLKRGPNAAVAMDFLGYLTHPENSVRLAQFFPPPRRSLLTADILARANPLLRPDQLRTVVIDGITTGVVRPNHTNGGEISDTVRDKLTPVWRPGADVRGALADVCRAITPLLAEGP